MIMNVHQSGTLDFTSRMRRGWHARPSCPKMGQEHQMPTSRLHQLSARLRSALKWIRQATYSCVASPCSQPTTAFTPPSCSPPTSLAASRSEPLLWRLMDLSYRANSDAARDQLLLSQYIA